MATTEGPDLCDVTRDEVNRDLMIDVLQAALDKVVNGDYEEFKDDCTDLMTGWDRYTTRAFTGKHDATVTVVLQEHY